MAEIFPHVRASAKCLIAIVIALSSAAATITPCAGVDVLVGRFDHRGTGANLTEKLLNTTNVNPAHFGKLFSYEIDGFAYAQPLIVSGIRVHGRTRNLLYVATTSSMVYALDADDPGPDGGLVWQVRLADHGAFPAPTSVKTQLTVQASLGILSTPVIDRARGAIYVVARSVGSHGHAQRVHALDLVTGQEKPGSPADIGRPSVTRDGITFTFDPEIQSNRAGLALSGSSVVIAWGGLDGDHGWVMAFDADTLARTGIFCTTCARVAALEHSATEAFLAGRCDGPRRPWLIGGGIWQSGRPPAVDDKGHVYYFVGNGWTLGCIGKTDWYGTACRPGQPKPLGYYSESLVRLDPRNGLALVGSWTPGNWCDIDRSDNDLGGSGPALVDFAFPDGDIRTFAVGGGKEGRLYSIDTGLIARPDLVEGWSVNALLGNFDVASAGPPFPCVRSHGGDQPHPHHIMGGPVIWARTVEGAVGLFLSLENDCARGFLFASGRAPRALTSSLVDRNPQTVTPRVFDGHPGGILSLSADGDRPGTGILWMTYALNNPPDEGATSNTRRGRLAAYSAEDLGRELWNSDMAAGHRDALGHFAKFNPPTIANGKVYAVSFPTPEPYKPVGKDKNTYHSPNHVGYLVVYGLNPPANPPVRSFAADILRSILSPLLAE